MTNKVIKGIYIENFLVRLLDSAYLFQLLLLCGGVVGRTTGYDETRWMTLIRSAVTPMAGTAPRGLFGGGIIAYGLKKKKKNKKKKKKHLAERQEEEEI